MNLLANLIDEISYYGEYIAVSSHYDCLHSII